MARRELKLSRPFSSNMAHPVYRNLASRDTLFGLDLYDLVVMAAVTNLVFRLHQPAIWSGKILNVVIVALSYVVLVLIKRQFPPGYLKNRVNFLFRRRRYRPEPEDQIEPWYEV